MKTRKCLYVKWLYEISFQLVEKYSVYSVKYRARFIWEASRDVVWLLKSKQLLTSETPFCIQDIYAGVVNIAQGPADTHPAEKHQMGSSWTSQMRLL